MSWTKPYLKATGITKQYRNRLVLDRAGFEVAGGKVLALTGPNGAGKSTLLGICAGLIRPDAGHIETLGVLGSGRIGYCPQHPGLLDHLSANEHFVYFGRARGLNRTKAQEEGRALLDQLHFPWAPEERRKPVKELSGGNRQKVNLAVALLGNPGILLLDEPYQGFDHGTYVDFWERVQHWRDQGKAVVIVTHMLAQLNLVDDRVELADRSSSQRSPGIIKRFQRLLVDASDWLRRLADDLSPADRQRRARARHGHKLSYLVVVALMHGRDLVRRRLSLAFLVVLPLAFYFTRIETPEDPLALKFGGIGLAWALATAAHFIVLGARYIDPRLVLAGFSPLDLLVGRFALLVALAIPFVAAFCELMISLSDPVSATALVLGVALAGLIAIPLGLSVAMVLGRELEGTLALIGLIGVEMSLPSDSPVAPFLPLYEPLKLLEIAAGSSEAMWLPVLVGICYATVFVVISYALWRTRVQPTPSWQREPIY